MTNKEIRNYAAAVLGIGSLAAAWTINSRKDKIKKMVDKQLKTDGTFGGITVNLSRSKLLDVPTPEEFEAQYNAQRGQSAFAGGADDLASIKRDILRKNASSAAMDKKAEGSFFDIFTHPIDTGKSLFSNGWQTPAKYIGAAAGSMLVAKLVVDAVNRRRKEKAEDSLDSARKEYIELLQNGEKTAEARGGTLLNAAAIGLGAAAIAPGLLAGIVVHKILEKRRKAKDEKDMESRGFPDEPMIFYNVMDGEKTASADGYPVSPNALMATILLKSAMADDLDNVPGSAGNDSMAKEAQFFIPSLISPASAASSAGVELGKKIGGKISGGISGMKKKYDEGKAVSAIRGHYNNGQWDDDAFKIINDKFDDKLFSIASSYAGGKPGEGMGIERLANLFGGNEQARSLLKDPRMTNLFMSRFNDPNNKKWYALGNDLVNRRIQNWAGGDNWLSKFLIWLSDVTGYNKKMLSNGIQEGMAGIAGKIGGSKV